MTDAPDPVTAGTNLTYTATVTNAGPSDATAVVVSLPTPAGNGMVSGTVSGGGSCAAGIGCAVTGSIAPGALRTLTIAVLVAASVLDGTVINATATVTVGSPDPVGANNSASTTTAVGTAADLVIGLTSTEPQVLANVPATFTATSVNNGPSDAQTCRKTDCRKTDCPELSPSRTLSRTRHALEFELPGFATRCVANVVVVGGAAQSLGVVRLIPQPLFRDGFEN